jgi:hypothetical protein
MRNIALRRLLALTATTGLAVALAACEPDDAQQAQALAPLLSQTAPQAGWSMDDLAAVDPQFLAGDAGSLPQALPMRASYRGDYDEAPAFDYGPEPYYDDGYYADDVGAGDYQWLALAAALGGMLGSAPPDYGFYYDGVEPWAWQTGDRYLRYAEPVYGGYRYYYYEPDSYAPFFVSDPYYSYGYRGDQLIVIYDRSGRVLDARRAERQRRAARDYFARARQLYEAGHRQPRLGVAAPLWDRHSDDIARDQHLWDQARLQRTAWRTWDERNQPKLHKQWAGEALVRREAERNFTGWQKADFKTPAPRFYRPEQRKAQLQKVAEIRRERRQQPVTGGVLAARPQAEPQRARAQHERAEQLARIDLHRQAQAQRQQVRHAAQQHEKAELRQDRQRPLHVQRAAAQVKPQADHRVAQRLQAQRAQKARDAQQHRQAQADAKAQQQRKARAEASAQQHRQAQAAAHARQQQAQKKHAQQQAQQAKAALQHRQAEQHRAAEQHKAQQAHAAQQRQKAEQQRASRQQQAQRQHAAQQQRQAAQQRAERQQQARQQQARQQQAARQQRQAQQARAAKAQHSAQQASQPAAKGGHGRGKDRG